MAISNDDIQDYYAYHDPTLLKQYAVESFAATQPLQRTIELSELDSAPDAA